MTPALARTGPGYGRGEQPRIRLMVVDDSMVARAVLTRMLEADGGFEIAAVAGTAEDAIEALAQVRVDIILLDLEMPGAGGLKSIPRILEIAHGARVMIVSSLAEEGAEETVAALALGAADTLPKPGTGRFNGRFSEILMSKLRALGRVEDQDAAPRASVRPASAVPLRAMVNDPLRLLAIGASTGGIHALGTFFQELPAKIGVPILVTQHLPAPFMAVFARQLGNAAGREAIVAEDGLRLLPDRIVIAPGDAHLTVDISGGHLVARLLRNRSASGCLPSLDPMLASAGRLLGAEALGVVLTGMGRDGLEGAMALIGAGGSVIVQDEASSAVWGMPRAVAEAGLACAILPPAKIARRVAARAELMPCK
jgi:two-component system, chemotaxis family, protein-glutamate methylesterase/glutaminase